MKENILSVVIALFLASIIFFGLLINFDNFGKLQTNVIGAEQEQVLGDIVIETYDDQILVKANKDIDEVQAASVMLLWNANEVTPDFENLKSKGRSEITEEYASRVTVFVNDFSDLKKGDELLDIPLAGNATQLSISDVVLLFADDSSERASLSTR